VTLRPRGVLLDLDGVVYNGQEPIPGAAQAVRAIQEKSFPHLFVTNTTSRPRAALVGKLKSMGVETNAERILTPAVVAAAWLHAQPPGPVALFLKAAARAEFEGLERARDKARYVVVGDLGRDWSYDVLNKAFQYLHADPDAVLVALGMTRYWMAPEGISLDVAPFVVALEHAADRNALVLGKPARGFFLAAVDRLGLAPEEVLMIGDDVKTDVGAAMDAGLKGALVKTGKFRPADLGGDVQPDLVVESLAGFSL